MDSPNRKTIFWVLITLAISLFALFIMLAIFVSPSDVQNSGLVDLTEMNQLQMVWILALMLFLGPIIMILVTAATIMLIKDVNTSEVQYQGMSVFKSQIIGKKPAVTANTTPTTEEATALDDLNLRFIRGEISKDEYDELKSELKKQNED